MTLVVDASVVIAGLVDRGAVGSWAAGLMRSDSLLAPHVMPAEVTNGLRRTVFSGRLSADAAHLAQSKLSGIAVDYFGFGPGSDRAWELRENLSAYDAWYVALAEAAHVPLATLDHRLTNAPGPRCEFRTFEGEPGNRRRR